MVPVVLFKSVLVLARGPLHPVSTLHRHPRASQVCSDPWGAAPPGETEVAPLSESKGKRFLLPQALECPRRRLAPAKIRAFKAQVEAQAEDERAAVALEALRRQHEAEKAEVPASPPSAPTRD